MSWLFAFMTAQGYIVSNSTVLKPTQVVRWLGKEVYLGGLLIPNLPPIVLRVVSYLVKIFDAVIPVKTTKRCLLFNGFLDLVAMYLQNQLVCILSLWCPVGARMQEEVRGASGDVFFVVGGGSGTSLLKSASTPIWR